MMVPLLWLIPYLIFVGLWRTWYSLAKEQGFQKETTSILVLFGITLPAIYLVSENPLFAILMAFFLAVYFWDKINFLPKILKEVLLVKYVINSVIICCVVAQVFFIEAAYGLSHTALIMLPIVEAAFFMPLYYDLCDFLKDELPIKIWKIAGFPDDGTLHMRYADFASGITLGLAFLITSYYSAVNVAFWISHNIDRILIPR